MKIHDCVSGNFRSEPAKGAPKRGQLSADGSAAAHRGRRDEYVKQSEKPRSGLYGVWPQAGGPADGPAAESDALEARIESLLRQAEAAGGGAGRRVHASDGRPAEGGERFSAASLLSAAFYRKGFRSGYTAADAAESLWRRAHTEIDGGDAEGLARLRERVRAGNFSLHPTEEELDAFTGELRRGGVGGVDWGGLSRELDSFGALLPDELEDALDYLASRFAAVRDRLERGGAPEAERGRLERMFENGAGRMIDGYAAGLQRAFGLSDGGVQGLRDCFAVLLAERTEVYAASLEQVRKTVAAEHPQDLWLREHDAYIAARLRETAGASGAAAARYSARDLTVAGEIAQAYRREAAGAAGGSAGMLALNVAVTDMKAETLILRGVTGEEMSALLRSVRVQGRAVILDASGWGAADRDLFDGVYSAAMETFRESGDAAAAIRSGADGWEDFFTAPEPRERSPLEQAVDDLLARIGQSRSALRSPYENYLSDWQQFEASLNRAGPLWL